MERYQEAMIAEEYKWFDCWACLVYGTVGGTDRESWADGPTGIDTSVDFLWDLLDHFWQYCPN